MAGDLWYLHRERILQGVGALGAMASVLVVALGIDVDEGAYELGWAIGVSMRGVIFGFIGAALIFYLIDRFYWYDAEASWKRLRPEAAACGGVAALAISLAFGAGSTDPKRVDPGESIDEAIAESVGYCDVDSNPVLDLPGRPVVELDADEAARVNPLLSRVPPEIAAQFRTYLGGSKADPVIFSVQPLPEDAGEFPTAASSRACSRRAVPRSALTSAASRRSRPSTRAGACIRRSSSRVAWR